MSRMNKCLLYVLVVFLTGCNSLEILSHNRFEKKVKRVQKKLIKENGNVIIYKPYKARRIVAWSYNDTTVSIVILYKDKAKETLSIDKYFDSKKVLKSWITIVNRSNESCAVLDGGILKLYVEKEKFNGSAALKCVEKIIDQGLYESLVINELINKKIVAF